MKSKVVVSFVVIAGLSGVLWGQAPTPATKEELQQMSERLAELQALQQRVQQGGGGRGTAPIATPFGPTTLPRTGTIGGAWWTNAALVTQLGLTDEQKTKIERAYENHKQTLTANTQALDKEESQLAKLLAADPIDRNAVLGEIDRVVQARGDLERTNSSMTLEMREVLTAAQWGQLQAPPTAGRIYTPFGPIANPRAGGPGQRTGGGQRQQ
jgi:hypothetical protein